MNGIIDLYYELGKVYEVDWNNDDLYSFNLYFNGKRGRKYKLNISEDIVIIFKKAKFFRWSYWDAVSHLHCDDGTIDDVLDGVQYYLDHYK